MGDNKVINNKIIITKNYKFNLIVGIDEFGGFT